MSLIWSDPRRGIIEDGKGHFRPGWISDLYACGIGLPDREVGTAQAPDRIFLKLVQAVGVVRVSWELLLYRLGLKTIGSEPEDV